MAEQIPFCGENCRRYSRAGLDYKSYCTIRGITREVEAGKPCHPEMWGLLNAINARRQNSRETVAA